MRLAQAGVWAVVAEHARFAARQLELDLRLASGLCSNGMELC